MFLTLERSQATAPSCLLQLTLWVPTQAHVAFAIRQLDRYGAPWKLKRAGDGTVAVFVPGAAQGEEVEEE